ncbi:MAG TPA: hypothetical protein VFV27_06375 [Nevskiaceae bacterium]|nr:hypothetical protein [Nevskiaceae bacterium]
MLRFRAPHCLLGMALGLASLSVHALTVVSPSRVYAEELAQPGAAITDDGLNVVGSLGFGMTEFQTRFLRFDVLEGQFNGAVQANNLRLLNPATNGVLNVLITIEAGGTAGSSSVTFRALSLAEFPQGARIEFDLGSGGSNGVRVTGTTAAARQIRYTLFDSAANASALTLPLETQFAPFGRTAPALRFALATQLTTLNIKDTFRRFAPNFEANDGFLTNQLTQLGLLRFDVTPGISNLNGGDVALGNLVGAGTRLKINATDLGSAADSQIFLDNDLNPDCAAGINPASRSSTEIIFNTGTTALDGAALCYRVNGLVRRVRQDVAATVELAPVAGSSVPASLNGLLGLIRRNGAELKIPYLFFNNKSNIQNFVQVINLDTVPVPYFIDCIGPGGLALEVKTGTLPVQQAVSFTRADLGCVAPADGAYLLFDTFPGRVSGVQVRLNTTTGEAGFDQLVGSR